MCGSIEGANCGGQLWADDIVQSAVRTRSCSRMTHACTMRCYTEWGQGCAGEHLFIPRKQQPPMLLSTMLTKQHNTQSPNNPQGPAGPLTNPQTLKAVHYQRACECWTVQWQACWHGQHISKCCPPALVKLDLVNEVAQRSVLLPRLARKLQGPVDQSPPCCAPIAAACSHTPELSRIACRVSERAHRER